MKPSALFVLNEPHVLRISPALAKEIGLNESILFLQIEYLIRISTTEVIDGKYWTYQSLQKMKDEYFPWWSIATISRIAATLKDMELIHIGNYNKRLYDRTQWYALNEVGISRLTSVRLNEAILQNEKWEADKEGHFANCKMEDDKLQNGFFKMKNLILQNETTIPETPTETPTNTMGVAFGENLPASAVESWKKLLTALKYEIPGPNYKTYLEPLQLVDYRNGGTRAVFVLAAPDEEKRLWAQERLGPFIRRQLPGIHNSDISLEFVLQGSSV